MENITLLFDLLIALLSLWVLLKLTGFSGLIGKSLTMVGSGIITIGFSQFVETIGLNYFNANGSTIELVHRFILLVGLIFIALGFRNLIDKK